MFVKHSTRAGRALLGAVTLAALAACGGGDGPVGPDGGLEISAANVQEVSTKLESITTHPALSAVFNDQALQLRQIAQGETGLGRTARTATARMLRAAERQVTRGGGREVSYALSSAGIPDAIEGKVFVRTANGWQWDPNRTAPAGTVRFIVPNTSGATVGTLDVVDQTVAGSNSSKYKATLTSTANVVVLEYTSTETSTFNSSGVQSGGSYVVLGFITNGTTRMNFEENYSDTGLDTTTLTYSWTMKHDVPNLVSMNVSVQGTDHEDPALTDVENTDLTFTVKNTTIREVYESTPDRITIYINGSVYAVGTFNGTDYVFRTPQGQTVKPEETSLFRAVGAIWEKMPFPMFAVWTIDYWLLDAEYGMM